MKTPPFNEELEKEILGTVFISSNAANRVIEICKPSDFYREKHRKIFLTMKEMYELNLKIDLVSINVQMGNEWACDLTEVYQYGITDVMLDQHIGQLKELSNQRKFATVCKSNDFDEIKNVINEIESDSIQHSAIIPPDHIEEKIYNYYEKGGDKGVSTGWKSLDKFYTISKGQITIVTGIPSHGKSEWLDAVAVELAENHNWKIMFFSPENFPVSRHVRKLMEKYSGFPFFEGFAQRLPKEDLKNNIDWINNHF